MADIFSLGVVFYELLTGEVPMGRFDPPSKKVQVDVRLDEVVLRSLAREPDRRYQHASEVKTEVETISGASFVTPHAAFGREYKSKTTLFGLPLVHVATGIDPKTGRKRIAKGIIAIGDVAVGVLACGGVAVGGLALGGLSIGLVTLGGLAIGVMIAAGGMAVGGVAVGGGALGVIAVGGGAVGYYACGGGAFGLHALGGNVRDPQAEAFFLALATSWRTYVLGAAACAAAVLASLVLAWFRYLVWGPGLVRRAGEKGDTLLDTDVRPAVPDKMVKPPPSGYAAQRHAPSNHAFVAVVIVVIGLLIIVPVVLLAGAVVMWLFLSKPSLMPSPVGPEMPQPRQVIERPLTDFQ